MRTTEYGFDLPEQRDPYDIDQYSNTIQKINDMLKDICTEIEVLEAGSDVVDVVASKAELDAYDKSHLTNNSIIKVLKDESESDAITYYRFTKNDLLPPTWTVTLIGSIGPYVTTIKINDFLPKVEEIN